MLGLPHDEDEDDDNHLCIKCNQTIIGLDNYVKHRKTICVKEKADKLSTYHQGADVFFQSLNLQSSSKKPPVPVQATTTVNSKTSAGVLTRRTVAAIISGSKDVHPPANADVFLSQKRAEDWIGEKIVHVADTDDNQTKLIKAVASISGKGKKDYAEPSFSVAPVYHHDDDSNEDSDDFDDFDDEDHIQTGGKWKPPIPSTGGKWKPHYGSRDTPSPRPDVEHNEDWEEEHTGGKWKTFLSQPVESFSRGKNPELHDMEDDDVDDYRPPPGHTRGKWIPGANSEYKSDHKTQIMDITAFHKEGGSMQFWCGPCNRKLSSRKNYVKHLSSSLHLKKTLPEKDLEFSGSFKHDLQVELGKREIKPSHYMNESIFCLAKQKRKSSEKNTDSVKGIKKKERRKRKIICISCKSKVKYTLMGKHLISHYHFRKADTSDDAYKTQILDNIGNIILQSPFQCSPCKFYCNWESELLKHWKSTEHQETVNVIAGQFWCSMCKYVEDSSSAFEEHLTGRDHKEFVAAINRSMPVIIRKKSIISCDVCNKQFKYNIQLNRHIKQKCFGSIKSTASNEYQGKMKCQICSHLFKSLVSLSRHMKSCHNVKNYICSKCNVEFSSSQEAKTHRKTQQHQIKSLEMMVKEGIVVKDLTRSCPHCDAPRFQNIIFLKRHIESEHQDQFYSCFRCGMKFPLQQEVTWHIRNGRCTYNTLSVDNKNQWTCNFCPFVTDSAAECWYHNLMLHGESKLVLNLEGTTVRYTCPMCPKTFSKDYFRSHLKIHTGERENECNYCDAKFFRKSALKFHIKRSHSMNTTTKKQDNDGATKQKREVKQFLCSHCGKEFSSRFGMKQHMTVHTGRQYRCEVEGCEYTGRCLSDVRTHSFSHNTCRPYQCSQCQYSAKTKGQLVKHTKSHEKDREKKFECPICTFKSDLKSRLEKHSLQHTDKMPFKCPHCPFLCKSLENLRKHILKRNKHSGKFMYECIHCNTYQTNFAKDLKIHIKKNHSNLYDGINAINDYVSNLLKVTST